jgi:hypothetical protein
LAAALTLPSAAFSQVFVSQGPAPGFGPLPLSLSADQPPSGPGLPRNGSLANAINAVAPDPSDPNTLYVGTVNGGVWVTRNGGTTWKALTDNQASLSITSLALDPTDPTHKTLIAGAGLSSAGSVDRETERLLGNRWLVSALPPKADNWQSRWACEIESTWSSWRTREIRAAPP